MEPTTSTTDAYIAMVTREGGKLFAHVEDGEKSWIVECKARDLQSFERFQQLLADEHGVWMNHDCQQYPARYAKHLWQEEVARAFFSGGR